MGRGDRVEFDIRLVQAGARVWPNLKAPTTVPERIPVPQAQGVDAKMCSISTLHGVVSRKRKKGRGGTAVAARGETL
jgi:hypothetical protein